MRPWLAIPLAAMVLFAGWYVSEDPTRIGPFFDFLDDYTNQVENEAPPVKMQGNENWLVVVVDFPNAPETGFRNIEKAETILTGVNGADDYISQLTAGQTTLNVTIVPTVYHAQKEDSYWGEDDGNVRDVGASGSNGPAGLAESVIKNSLSGIDLSPFDLDSDGWIDRFLLIHTADVQEDGGGSGAIWSHYGPLTQSLEINEFKFDHYTIAGFDSGFGTIMHEMLHQMGALDLYDVHGHGTGEDWNGLGDWDVMASGNWNGPNGRTPALPSLATMELIGVDRATEISLAPTGDSQTYELTPLSDDGQGIFIQISPSERVWMAYRGDLGFDRKLPGHGLLVTIQDSSVGDLEQNLVNTNRNVPWLYVLEADGDSGLLSGNDEGSSGDVFKSGEKFGAEGQIIVDHFGRQVDWTVEIFSLNETALSLSISTPGTPTFEVYAPHQPIQLLTSEDMQLVVNSTNSCMLEANLVSSDGRNVSLVENSALTPPTSARTIRWDGMATAGSEARITGEFTCGTSPAQSVDIIYHTIGLRLTSESFSNDIPVEGGSSLEVPLEFTGHGQQTWEVRLEGPLSRIATTQTQQNLGDGARVNLSIDPNGLLVPGMVARGDLVLRDSQGLEQSVEIILTAEQFEQSGEVIRFLSEPSNLIMVMAGLFAFSILLGMRTKESQLSKIKKAGKKKASQNMAPQQMVAGQQIGHYPSRQTQTTPITIEQLAMQDNTDSNTIIGLGQYEAQQSGFIRPKTIPQNAHQSRVTYDPNGMSELDDLL